MSLETRLTALATAIGADIKAARAAGYNTAPIGSTLIVSTKAMPAAGPGPSSRGLSDYVVANGQELLRTDYPDAWAFAQAEIAAGNTDWGYGTGGAGGTVFTVPNFVDKFPLATGANPIGARGGAVGVMMTLAHLIDHEHVATYTGVDNVTSTNDRIAGTDGGGSQTSLRAGGVYNKPTQIAIPTMPPWAAVAFIVKVRGATANADVIQGPSGPAGTAGATGPVGYGAIEGWHTVGAAGEPAFVGTWVNFSGTEQAARFRRDPLGHVLLSGVVKLGTMNTTVFTLPVGYRPPLTVRFAVPTNGVFGYIEILATGEVQVKSGSNVWVDLTGVEFDTDTVVTVPAAQQRFPSFSAHRNNVDATAITTGVTQVIQFPTEDWDTHNWFDTATGRFTPQVAGYYRINGQLAFTTGIAQGNRLFAYLLKNGGIVKRGVMFAGSPADEGRPRVAALVYANGSTDYFQIASHANSTGNYTISGSADGTYFQAELVEAAGAQLTTPITALVTTLPASPVDGQEVYLRVAAPAAPSGAHSSWATTNGDAVIWHLRYNATITDAYKWEFLGGAPFSGLALGYSSGSLSAINAWQDSPLPVALSAPRAGIYDIELGSAQSQPQNGAVSWLGFSIAGTVQGSPQPASYVTSTSVITSPHGETRVAVTPAGADVRLKHQTQDLTASWRDRYLRMVPVRLA